VTALRVEPDGDAEANSLLWVKAVPGASRSEIKGVLGEALKVRVPQAPEGGKANQAICSLVARALALAPDQVSVERGQSAARKVLRIQGLAPDAVRTRLGQT